MLIQTEFKKAGGAARERVINFVMSYLSKSYPEIEHARGLYEEWETYTIVRKVLRSDRPAGGILMRVTGDIGEFHVIADPKVMIEDEAVRSFLAFLQYHGETRRIRTWETAVRVDNVEAREALMRLGFTPHASTPQFTGYRKEV